MVRFLGYKFPKLKIEIQSLAKKLAILTFSLIKHPFSRGPGRL